ncbi:MAG: hypothetical protein WCR04_11400 [Fibrobacteraceae bacterium]
MPLVLGVVEAIKEKDVPVIEVTGNKVMATVTYAFCDLYGF